jgi:N-acetylmuramoyl-L-alanine amidase
MNELLTMYAPLVSSFRGRVLRGLAPVAIGVALLWRSGTAPAVAQDPPRPPSVVVQPGDTLSGLAVRFYGDATAVGRILAANNITDPDKIIAGASLVLPSGSAATTTTATAATNGRKIIVGPGDSLSALSERLYGSAGYASALAALNGITDPNHIVAGMTLLAPASPPAPPALTAAGGAVSAAPVSTTAAGGPLAGKRICIDPGHGGAAEPGSVFDFGDGKVLREADVTLDISRTLRAWLQADGAAITMTRNSDTFVGLDERAAICNAAGADITVSVHLNGGSNPGWDGALALFFKALDRKLAQAIVTALHPGLGRTSPAGFFTDYGAQEFDGAVLRGTTMPAVIVEPVFLTNPLEARALLSPTSEGDSRRNQIVRETYRGLRAYFGQ